MLTFSFCTNLYRAKYNTISGSTEYYTEDYCDGKSSSYSSTSEWNSDRQTWLSYYQGKKHKLVITYDGEHTICIYDNDQCVKTFNNATSICHFSFKVGTAALLEATDFKIEQKTNYGIAMPYIQKAGSYMDKEDYVTALQMFNHIIDQVKYYDFKVYFGRAWCNFSIKNYRKAINDCESALSCESFSEDITNQLIQDCHFIRGLSKYELGEDYLGDMHQAGEAGDKWLQDMATKQQNDGLPHFLPEKFKSSRTAKSLK